MPSAKLKAAMAGRPYVRPSFAAPAATARFGVVPKDPDLARVQEDLRASGGKGGSKLGQSPFETGQIIDVDFGEGLDQTIPHQLGGAAKGFVVCDKVSDIAVDIVRCDDTTTVSIDAARAESHVRLIASSACKAKIWVWR